MDKQNLQNDEIIFLEGAGVYLKTNFNVIQGTFFLTSNKFIFCKRSGLLNAVTGPLLMHLVKGSNMVFEIELSKIKSINSEKHGFGSKFIFSNAHGEKFALQFMSNKEKWLQSIQDAIKKHNPMITVSKIGDNYSFSLDEQKVDITNQKTSDEALSELKRAKDKFDLELITKEEYEKVKEELRKFIN